MLEISQSNLVPLRDEVVKAAEKIASFLKETTDQEELNTQARVLALNLSRIYCASLLIEHAQWDQSERSALIASRFVRMGLYQDFQSQRIEEKELQSILKI